MTYKRSNKDSKLVEAMTKLLKTNSYYSVPLADVAREADVPLGNVYYYFKTKKAIVDRINTSTKSATKSNTELLEERADIELELIRRNMI